MSYKFSPFYVFTTGIAIFGMFFGAGNVVFPLVLGNSAGNNLFPALLGLLITGIGAPLLGLLGSILFRGEIKLFFTRIGFFPGSFLIFSTLSMLGPFAVLPRCVTVAYGAFNSLFPNANLLFFCLFFSLFCLLATLQRSKLLPLLGKFLSPILLGSLLLIIIKGYFSGVALAPSDWTEREAFFKGLDIGYDTMDLIASIFFSASIWHLIKQRIAARKQIAQTKAIFRFVLSSGLIGMGLLGAVYLGLSYITALNSHLLQSTPPQHMLSALSYQILGPQLGSVANLTVVIACLTTVISLSIAIGDLLKKDYLPTQTPHFLIQFGILGITCTLSLLDFETLMHFLHPLVSLFYPSIIVLTLCNISFSLWGWRAVKIPVFITFLTTICLDYIVL